MHALHIRNNVKSDSLSQTKMLDFFVHLFIAFTFPSLLNFFCLDNDCCIVETSVNVPIKSKKEKGSVNFILIWNNFFITKFFLY